MRVSKVRARKFEHFEFVITQNFIISTAFKHPVYKLLDAATPNVLAKDPCNANPMGGRTVSFRLRS